MEAARLGLNTLRGNANETGTPQAPQPADAQAQQPPNANQVAP